MENNSTVMAYPEMDMLPISMLKPDPNQPRKTTNPQKDQELCDSIKSEGILQSLLVRSHGENQYMIVCGHRRYHAALKAGLLHVPAMVVDMNDQEALIRQHIENIQRDNVNVMEQAKSFKLLLSDGKTTLEDIKTRIGKSVYYVKQNLKLNDLTDKWQHMLYLSALTVPLALQIAQLHVDAQQALYQDVVCDEQANTANPQLNLSSNQIKKYQGFLCNAMFDRDDATLVEKAGSCTGCPFNSSTANLFPAEVTNPRCSNLSCFKEKENAHLQKEIEVVKSDPSLLMVYQSYYQESEVAATLINDGYPVLLCRYNGECHMVSMPDQPDLESFMDRAKQNKLSKKEAVKQFKEQLNDYEEKKSFVQKQLDAGIYKKALMVDDQSGSNTGRYVIVEMNEKEQKANKKIDLKSPDITAKQVQSVIDGINDRYKRSLELDEEHVQEAIVAAYKEDKGKDTVPKRSVPADTALLNFILLEQVSFSNHQTIAEALKIPNLWQEKNLANYLKAVMSLTKTQLAFIARQIFENKFITYLPNTKAGYLFRKFAEQLKCFPIADIEAAQAEKTRKRTANKNERISSLEEQKKALSKDENSKPSKKSSTKSSAKKQPRRTQK